MDPEVWTFTPEQIRQMPMEEYAKLRNSLLQRVKVELTEQQRTGKPIPPERLRELGEIEDEEADRKRLIEELKRQQGQ